MNGQSSFEEFGELLFRFRWYLFLVIFGIILILLGIFSFTRQPPWSVDKVEILNGAEEGQILVEISGAVQKPGVYKFTSGARVEELLIASGGLSSEADREWVSRVLNRAAKLTDGQKIFIPERGTTSITPRQSSGQAGTTGGISLSGLVNINAASQAELEALPGIGPVTAGRIIEGRPYSGVEELLTRKIFKKSVYETNKEKLSVY